MTEKENVHKFMQYIEKLAKDYELNLPNRSYDIYAFAKDLLVWLEKQRDKDKLIQELGKYKVKYTQEVLEKYINNMSNKDDERLRKTAISFLKDFAEQGYENAVECIDWLEKQGEQNPYSGVSFKYNGHTWGMCARDNGVEILVDGEIKESIFLDNKPRGKSALEAIKEEKVDNEFVKSLCVEPKFKVGDWVVNKFGDSWHIDSFDKKNYQVSDGKGNYNYFPISKQDEMHLWTMQDAKDGDVICYRDEISLYKYEIKNCNKQDTTFGGFVYYCCYDSKRFITNSFYLLTGQDEIDIYPATKEQRDSLMKAMNDAGYEWDAEKKELKLLVSNQDSYVTDKKDKFDPKNLKPFDKVLVRNLNDDAWSYNFFSYIREVGVYKFMTITGSYRQCIPYNDNTKHLARTTNEAPEYYRYWEE